MTCLLLYTKYFSNIFDLSYEFNNFEVQGSFNLKKISANIALYIFNYYMHHDCIFISCNKRREEV